MNNQQPIAVSSKNGKKVSFQQCVSSVLTHLAKETFSGLENREFTLKKGDHLFRTGDPFRAIYVIRSGCIKTSMLSSGGDVQVLRFSLPGESVGTNAIGIKHHSCDAVALEPTEVCEIPFARLEKLALENPQVQHRLMCLLSDEIAMDGKFMAMLGHQKAEARVANCLLNFNQRYQQQGYYTTSFRLPMSRQDMGDYLGLSLETISRLLSRFQAEGLLGIQGRQVHLFDLARLQSVAEHCPTPAADRA
jgi:CRP/FNR family transcriptional regulator